jgi:V/A-type H+-transporting ATPase subunit I
MSWLDAVRPVRMQRIAIVAPRRRLRAVLVALAGCGLAELDVRAGSETSEPAASDTPAIASVGPDASPGPAGARVPTSTEPGGLEPARLALESRQLVEHVVPRVVEQAPAIEELERSGRWELLSGELELRRMAAQAVRHRGAAVLLGWTPRSRVAELSTLLAGCGTDVVRLPHPARAPAPTLITGSRASRPFRPLVDTYGTVPYTNVDPTLFAGVTYALMFGMMFGDVGHGLILAGLGVVLCRSRRPALVPMRRIWPLIVAAGLSAAVFGALYGEAFGPTGVVPTLWLEPVEDPIALLAAGILVGAVLLALSYVIGIVNRWREGGSARALYAASGIAGACLYFGAGAAVAGLLLSIGPLVAVGVATAGIGLALLFIGFLTASGGGVAGVTEALVELVDAVVRTASNAVSFARLAAFGLTHAAIAGVVWMATTAIAGAGGLWVLVAAAVFLVGNALAFGLEALVAGVQSLRLEYYELFSRIFSGEGRAFRPWHLAVAGKEAP